MSRNLLRDVFSDTSEDELLKLAEKIYSDCLKEREHVRLAPDKTCPGLYMRVDKKNARQFVGDCCFCSKHTPEIGIADGFWCLEHGWACGYGFTCPDNDYKENVGWPEFERIRSE